MTQKHILYWRDIQIAAAERFQRLCMEMAKYPARVQKNMRITSGTPPARKTRTVGW